LKVIKAIIIIVTARSLSEPKCSVEELSR